MLCARPTSSVRAFVIPNNVALIFCPNAFTETPYVTAARAMNDPKTKTPGAYIDEFQSWSDTMSHEWGHLVLHRMYYLSYTDQSTSLTASPVIDEIATDGAGRDLDTDGVPTRMYGFGRVSQTARFYPDRVRKTPEAYTRHSMAVFYTENNKWGLQYVTGRPEPWKQL